jgi:hypothetical protein
VEPFAEPAFDPDPAAHALDQILRDRKPQPCTSVLARRRRIRLAERLEHPAALLGRHADPRIADPEMQLDLGVPLCDFLHADDDLAFSVNLTALLRD